MITDELAAFSGSGDELTAPLAGKPRIVAATKIDALDDPERLARLTQHLEPLGVPVYPISAATGAGIDALLEALWREVARTAPAVAH